MPASSRATSPPTIAYTTAARPQLAATFAFSPSSEKIPLNGVTSQPATSYTTDTIALPPFAPSRWSTMPTTMTPTTTAVTSLTILARSNNSSPPRGWCPLAVWYPSHAAAKQRRMGNNPGMGEDRGYLVDAAKRRLQRAAWIANIAGAIDIFTFTLLLFPVHSDVLPKPPLLVNSIAF